MTETIYDNADVAESYAGVTTPLTFSFARYVYQKAYWNFAKMMGVRNEALQDNAVIFEHTIEYIGGRVYNNITNRDALFSLFSIYSFHSVTTLASLKWRVKEFSRYFEATFAELQSYDLDAMNVYELERLYRITEMKLMAEWKTPMANDFAISVSTRAADTLFKRWLGSDDAFHYMQATESIPLASLDPGKEILHIVGAIKADESINLIFTSKRSDSHVLYELQTTHPTHVITRAIEAYIKSYGARMPNELKLESKTLWEEPAAFISLLRNAMSAPVRNAEDTRHHVHEALERLSPFKRGCLKWLLNWAGNSIHRREQTRFYRTLVYGHIRRIFLAIGRIMAEKGSIDNERDIFFLTTDEIFRSFDMKNSRALLMPFITRRKKEYEQWKHVSLPNRIVSEESIATLEKRFLHEESIATKNPELTLKGRVASRPRDVDTISGTALSIKQFDASVDYTDKIIVTCQTDPGWTILFPFIRGIIVERGGMLSHAAIVARELNIPCIIGVDHATDVIETDMTLILDLQRGSIQHL